MAGTKVQIKRSSVAGRAPTTSDIDVGELAVNLTDNRLFTKDGSNTIIEVLGQSLNTTANVTFRDGAFANISATTLAGNLEWSYVTSKPDLKIDITGDATGNNTFTDLANGSIQLTLANTTVTSGTYGNSSAIPVLTIDSKGRITAATTNTVAGITGFSYSTSNNTFTITAGDGSTYKATIDTVNTLSVSNTLTVTGVGTFSNDVTVTGNLSVLGVTSFINTTQLDVGDNIITLNADVTGTPVLDAGIEIARGNQANVSLLWNETSDVWTFTNDGTTYLRIASNTDVSTSYSNATSYADAKAANAYSNAVSYADSKAANAYSNAVSYTDVKAANAYSNAVNYADTVAATAYSNATSYADTKAATAYSNATSYADTKAATAYSNAVSVAATDASTKAATAYSNAVSYADAVGTAAYSNATSYADNKAATAYSNAVSVAATDATDKAANAYSNAVSYADTKAATAYSNATSYADTKAAAAYSNAVSVAATDATTKAGTAYSNAVSTAAADATTKAATAYSNATSYADAVATTAYNNAVAYTDAKASNAYSNATSYADSKAATAYSNAVAYTDTRAATNTYVNTQLALKANLSGPTFTGLVTVSGTASFAGNVEFGNTRITANGGVGTAGQVLTSGGPSGNLYWANVATSNGVGTLYTISTSANLTSANVILTGADSTIGHVKFVGNGGIDVSSNGTAIVINGSNITGGGGNGYGTVAVSGQSSLIAQQTNAALTFVAGNNMTITTNATSGEITFSSNGGGTSLGTGPGNAFISARDNFTGNGSNTTFTLSQSATANSILVLVEGLVQFHSEDYDVSGTTLTFVGAPANNEAVEVLHIAGATTYHFMQYGAIDAFTGNGSDTVYTLSRTANTSTATVYLDGLIQAPTTDFSFSGNTLTFTVAPLSGESVLVYHNDSVATAIPGTAIASTDTFAGDGSTTSFTLSGSANSSTSVVSINGLVQGYGVEYSVSGLTLSFNDAPPAGSIIQAMRLVGSVGAAYTSITVGSSTIVANTPSTALTLANTAGVTLSASNNTVNIGLTDIAKQSLTGDGIANTFTLTYSATSDDILVYVNGVYFHPDEDYTVTGTTLSFFDPPIDTSQIRIRFMRAPSGLISLMGDLTTGAGSYDMSTQDGPPVDLNA